MLCIWKTYIIFLLNPQIADASILDHYEYEYLLVNFILIIFRNKMVKIGLQIKAFFENVTDLEAEGEDFR